MRSLLVKMEKVSRNKETVSDVKEVKQNEVFAFAWPEIQLRSVIVAQLNAETHAEKPVPRAVGGTLSV